jgi:hypothetical protein
MRKHYLGFLSFERLSAEHRTCSLAQSSRACADCLKRTSNDVETPTPALFAYVCGTELEPLQLRWHSEFGLAGTKRVQMPTAWSRPTSSGSLPYASVGMPTNTGRGCPSIPVAAALTIQVLRTRERRQAASPAQRILLTCLFVFSVSDVETRIVNNTVIKDVFRCRNSPSCCACTCKTKVQAMWRPGHSPCVCSYMVPRQCDSRTMKQAVVTFNGCAVREAPERQLLAGVHLRPSLNAYASWETSMM